MISSIADHESTLLVRPILSSAVQIARLRFSKHQRSSFVIPLDVEGKTDDEFFPDLVQKIGRTCGYQTLQIVATHFK